MSKATVEPTNMDGLYRNFREAFVRDFSRAIFLNGWGSFLIMWLGVMKMTFLDGRAVIIPYKRG